MSAQAGGSSTFTMQHQEAEALVVEVVEEVEDLLEVAVVVEAVPLVEEDMACQQPLPH
jgi:hypothetical protein